MEYGLDRSLKNVAGDLGKNASREKFIHSAFAALIQLRNGVLCEPIEQGRIKRSKRQFD
jgi:hypothetical protein